MLWFKRKYTIERENKGTSTGKELGVEDKKKTPNAAMNRGSINRSLRRLRWELRKRRLEKAGKAESEQLRTREKIPARTVHCLPYSEKYRGA